MGDIPKKLSFLKSFLVQIRAGFGKGKRNKLPALPQWLRIFQVLGKKEKIFFLVFLLLFLTSFCYLILNFYFKNTLTQPAFGGELKEGVLGQPRYLNPIYSSANDADRDITELVFSGLLKYSPEGEIIPDSAESYEIKEGGKVYEFSLKNNIFWHDGKPFSADDIIFTINAIKGPDYKSPLRASLFGVEVEKISQRVVSFKLKSPYPAFLETLTLKILPKHIWQDVSPENFPLTTLNLKPIGTGPYQFKSLRVNKESEKFKSLTLTANRRYYDKKPYLEKITFYFFETEVELEKAVKKQGIQNFSLSDHQKISYFKERGLETHYLAFPRYFAIFFNPQKSKLLSESTIRKALNYASGKSELVSELFLSEDKIADSPILPEFYGWEKPDEIYEYNLEKAKEILEKDGWEDENGDGKREKIIKKETPLIFKGDLKLGSQGNEVKALQECLANPPAGGPEIYPEAEVTGIFGEKTKAAVIKFQEKYAKEILEPQGFKTGTGQVKASTRKKLNDVCQESTPQETIPLKFTLVTVQQPILEKIASIIKEQWLKAGIEIEVHALNLSILEQEYLKPRNYEMILFGEALGQIPDPYPFWHSSQKIDPGLNLAMYQSTKADKLLEEARQTQDPEKRAKIYQEFQDILIQDAPALFLYSPDYPYLASKDIKGIKTGKITDPAKRFAGIEEWYIKTKRRWK